MREEEKILLYLYGYSPRKTEEIENLEKILKIQTKRNVKIILVFIQDGVIVVAQKNKHNISLNKILNFDDSKVSFYAIKEDLIARGLRDYNHEKIKPISYEELVDLLLVTDSVISLM
jgi:sulfur relay protein TusB/DsrH